MNLPKKYFVIIYVIIFLCDSIVMTSLSDFRIITKPLLVISLMLYTWIYYSFSSNKLFFCGLIFALLGDIFLIFKSESYFLAGLSSFLIMQIIYAICFFRQRGHLTGSKMIFILLLLIITISVLAFIRENLDNMFIPVLVYSFTIWGMVSIAILRKKNLPGYHSLLWGALLFLISDTFLAYGAFVSSFYGLHLVVMMTYVAAQYFIVINYTKSKKRIFSV